MSYVLDSFPLLRQHPGMATLGSMRRYFTHLEPACPRCGRKGRLSLDRLIREHGAAMGLDAYRTILRASCPRGFETRTYELCGQNWPQLNELYERGLTDAEVHPDYRQRW